MKILSQTFLIKILGKITDNWPNDLLGRNVYLFAIIFNKITVC